MREIKIEVLSPYDGVEYCRDNNLIFCSCDYDAYTGQFILCAIDETNTIGGTVTETTKASHKTPKALPKARYIIYAYTESGVIYRTNSGVSYYQSEASLETDFNKACTKARSMTKNGRYKWLVGRI